MFARFIEALGRGVRGCFGVREPLAEYPDDWVHRSPNRSETESGEDEDDPVAMVKAVRLSGLRSRPARFGIMPSARFPVVWGVFMEVSLDDSTQTIVGICDGNASLYFSKGHAMIDGVLEEDVRDAAITLVAKAAEYEAEATPAKRFPYPDEGQIRFYLLTFDGVKYLDADLNEAVSGTHRYSPLVTVGNELFTQLRRLFERRVTERN